MCSNMVGCSIIRELDGIIVETRFNTVFMRINVKILRNFRLEPFNAGRGFFLFFCYMEKKGKLKCNRFVFARILCSQYYNCFLRSTHQL